MSSKSKYRTKVHRNEMKPVSDAEDGGIMFLQNFGTYLPNATTSHPRMLQYCLITYLPETHEILFLCSVINYSKLRLCNKKHKNCFHTVKRDTKYVLCKPQLSDISMAATFPNPHQTLLQNVTSIFKRTTHLLMFQRNRISGMFP